MTTPTSTTKSKQIISSLKRGTWNPEEDEKLVSYINRYGIWNWNEMPKAAGLSRSGKSCRLRWMNYLRPNIRRGNFSKEEQQTIINMHQKLGNRWSTIAAKLPGRTDNEIKNYWHTHLKKLIMKNNANDQKLQKINISEADREPSISTSNEPFDFSANSYEISQQDQFFTLVNSDSKIDVQKDIVGEVNWTEKYQSLMEQPLSIEDYGAIIKGDMVWPEEFIYQNAMHGDQSNNGLWMNF